MQEQKRIDLLELYSFAAKVYGYTAFYAFISQQPLSKAVLYQILAYMAGRNFFGLEVLSFFRHPYFRSRIKDIAAPQALTCAIQITLNSGTMNMIGNGYDKLLSIPIHILAFYGMQKIFPTEVPESMKLRSYTSIGCIIWNLFS